MADKDENLEFDRMPGSDDGDQVEDTQVDLNFGLGATEESELDDSDEKSDLETLETEDVPTAEETSEDTSEDINDEAEAGDEPVALEEAEAEDVEDVLEEPKAKKKGQMVPKSRLDEVLAKQKALQKQLDELKQSNQPPEPELPSYDFEAKEREYQELILDGEPEKAAKVRSDIRAAEREAMSHELRREVEHTVSRNNEETALQQAAALLETEYPVFDLNSADYNEDFTQEVIELRDAFIVQGLRAVDALSKASNFVIKAHDIGAEIDDSSALAAKQAPKKALDEVAKKRAEVAKKLDAAKKQPPELPGESSSSHGEKALDISTLSEEEFNALPEATLRRLRGDIF
jgi:hypothetical protein